MVSVLSSDRLDSSFWHVAFDLAIRLVSAKVTRVFVKQVLSASSDMAEKYCNLLMEMYSLMETLSRDFVVQPSHIVSTEVTRRSIACDSIVVLRSLAFLPKSRSSAGFDVSKNHR